MVGSRRDGGNHRHGCLRRGEECLQYPGQLRTTEGDVGPTRLQRPNALAEGKEGLIDVAPLARLLFGLFHAIGRDLGAGVEMGSEMGWYA